MKTAQQVLENCIVDGLVIKLPDQQLDRGLYVEVKKCLELIGGKWKGGKVQGFVFLKDPTELLAQIAGGEKRNLKKEFQFFASPKELADLIVFEAQIEPFHRVLEPQAGQGALIEAAIELFPDLQVYGCELMEINRDILVRDFKANFILLGEDFFKLPIPTEKEQFDVVIANPPFAKNQDIDHIYRMWDFVKAGGRIVTVCSNHFMYNDNKKETEFRNWLGKIGVDTIPIEKGTFKESGTMVGAMLLILNKPKI